MTATRHDVTLADIDTPFAVVDAARARRNVERLRSRLDLLGVVLRPHMKTAKSLAAAAMMQPGFGPITVSTLAEAEAFADAGYTDITYAVGIAPDKLPRVVALLRRGVVLSTLLDSTEQADAVVEAAQRSGVRIPAFIEIDCDGHRGGVTVEDPALPAIGKALDGAGCLAGVLVHAGQSYFAPTLPGRRRAAENERDVAVAAAGVLRACGVTVDAVSVGSTPTAHAAEDLTGVTEVRAGNFVFFDLVMAGLGVCGLDDLALAVVVTVIGHRREHDAVLTDGGWMAMSRDRGTADQAQDQGYGLVTDLGGTIVPGVVMTGASQEHGVLTARAGHRLPDLPLGTRLRVLPNHACATAAQHRSYHVVDSDASDLDDGAATVREVWERITGW